MFKIHFVSYLLFPGRNKIIRRFRRGLIDETASSKHLWSIVQPNKNSISTWSQSMENISNNDGIFHRLIR